MNSFGKLSFSTTVATKEKNDITSSYLNDILSMEKESIIKSVLFEDSSTNKLLRYYSLDSILSLNKAVDNQPFLDISDDDVKTGFWHLRKLFDVPHKELVPKAISFCNSKFDVITMFAKANKRKRMSYDFSWLKDNAKAQLLAENLLSKVHDKLPSSMSNLSTETTLNFITLKILRFYDYLYLLKAADNHFQYDDFDFSLFQLPKKSPYHFEKNEKSLENVCSIIALTFDDTISFQNYMLALTEKLVKGDGVSNE